ncbi:MAG: uracil-DNA glycosylase [Alphaproteobacteria bacterium]|nr:uracil-DNA glycosylase [Alphaproteobacteria bacterium]
MQSPAKNCSKCPRLCGFRKENAVKFPGYHNAPVPSFGELSAELLVVGLAPGLHGANQTGRPFTGDYAGIVLYAGLQKYGFTLANCRITNAVRCVPQENKPEPSEIKNCNVFLKDEIAAMPNLKAILSLGLVSHNAVLRALGLKASAAKFAHGAIYSLPATCHLSPVTLYDSYHCSRYNINTGRLSQGMFDVVIENISSSLRGA